MTERATFGPVVLLGLAGSGFAAVAGHKAMLAIPEATITAAGGIAPTVADRSVEFPLAGALSLVGLAAWGVLLVTRGVVRRIAAVLALASAAGVGAVVVLGGFVQDDEAAGDLATRLGLSADVVDVERTGWLWVALLCVLVAAVASAAAVRLVPSWPEMGSRYDAPSAAGAPVPESAEQSNLDLWKSLDEGHDPTDEPDSRPDH